MRLINTTSLELREFFGEPTDPRFPKYAILSHTWGEAEVTFQDMQTIEVAKKKAGFAKIAKCCETALSEGLGWAWVDTCCIDKTSSAELSEAINSMFKWYEHSVICYAYLSDVGVSESDSQAPPLHPDWRASRWFTRGWTLQELVAPFEVIIYDHEWKQLGTKRRMASHLAVRTRIPEKVLLNPALIRENPVAARMSWAGQRDTTRIEDRAYSLLGLFDINMPLLYGEGKKALSRLHGEILNAMEDDTIFLGGLVPKDKNSQLPIYTILPGDDFLITPDNIFNILWSKVQPVPSVDDRIATQPYSSADDVKRWRRSSPMTDLKLRGDVLSMHMRIIQVDLPNHPHPRTQITMKKQFRDEMDSTNQQVLNYLTLDSSRYEGRSLCLGILHCGIDGQLVARYFMCLLVNDEIFAYPLPIYRFVSADIIFDWPYMQCHISLNRRLGKLMLTLRPLRQPASWGLLVIQPIPTFSNGWTLHMDPTSHVNYDKIVSAYRLRFERSTEIWNLTLTHTRPSGAEIILRCSTDPDSKAQIVDVNRHEREGPVIELCRRMPVLGGSAELVVSLYYEIDSSKHYLSPMIRFRAFEPSDDDQARIEPETG
ncbi:heterokaryon incompatibility protein-domain-containing protein [Xylaria sp. FL1777]|nr:heterokaryon incompatibility protein-domain-containing protein [Xylaria sp. FL1777]